MFKNKNAFSYIELLFGMVIVVIIFSASIPFITKKSLSQPAIPGTFICFSAYDSSDNSFKLYQTMRRGDGNFSELDEVSENGCNFYKQKNIARYNVTLIGGGGAARATSGGSSILGQNGSEININNTTLAGVWDENNILNIRSCRNVGLITPAKSYVKEHEHCIGNGGASHRNWSRGGIGSDELIYTELLGVYHDLLYTARSNIDTVNYVGLGNGALDADDAVTLFARLSQAAAHNDTRNRLFAGINRYLELSPAEKASTAEKDNLFELARALRNLLQGNAYNGAGSHGAAGGYTRFVLYDTHPLDCVDGFGNCVADGGVGGGFPGSNSVVAVGALDASMVGVNNDMLDEIEALISDGTNDDALIKAYLGLRGYASSVNGTSPVANGGAIIISW